MSAIEDIRWITRRFQGLLALTEKLEKYDGMEAYEAELSAAVDKAKGDLEKSNAEHAAHLADAKAELEAAQADVSKAQSQAKSARMKARDDAAQIVADAQVKAEELIAAAVAQVERLTAQSADLGAINDDLKTQVATSSERLRAIEIKIAELKDL